MMKWSKTKEGMHAEMVAMHRHLDQIGNIKRE